MHTRKSIGDKNGVRSKYVVEYLSVGGKWYIYEGNDGNSNTYRGAVALKKAAYYKCKRVNKRWTWKQFRVALYIRGE